MKPICYNVNTFWQHGANKTIIFIINVGTKRITEKESGPFQHLVRFENEGFYKSYLIRFLGRSKINDVKLYGM